MPDPQYPNRDILNIGLEAGRPSAYAYTAGNTANNMSRTLTSLSPPSTPPPSQNVFPQTQGQDQTQLFGLSLMELLRQYQNTEKYPFAQQGLNAQQQQVNRLSFTDPGLIGASPSVQAGARNAEASALDPTIRGSQIAGQTFQSQLQSFGDYLTQARTIQKQAQDYQDKVRDDARAVIKDALTIGGSDALRGANPDELAALEKTAGYPKGYIESLSSTIKQRELTLKQQHEDDLKALGIGKLQTQTPQGQNITVNFPGQAPINVKGVKSLPKTTASGSQLTQGAQEMLAQMMIAGNPAAMGLGTQLRIPVFNKAASDAVSMGLTGYDLAGNAANFSSDKITLTALRRLSETAKSSEATVLKQSNLVLSNSSKVGRVGWDLVNGWIQTGKIVTGDTPAHLFANSVITFTTEYAKIMTGSTGSVSGSTDSARKEAAQFLSTSFNDGTIQDAVSQMIQEAKFRIEGYDQSIQETRMRLSSAPKGITESQTKQSNTGDSKRITIYKGGKPYNIPNSQLQDALNQGYTQSP